MKKICRNTFRLTSITFNCSAETSLYDFVKGIIVSDDNGDDGQELPPVVITTRLNEPDQKVQTQALELIRNKHLFADAKIRHAPQNFLLICLLPIKGSKLTPLLNDHMFISHTHTTNDGLPHLALFHRSGQHSSTDSLSSIIRKTPLATPELSEKPTITQSDISQLRSLSQTISLDSDVRAYTHDLIIFLRTNRFVAGGVSVQATQHFLLLSRVLAPLHSLKFVTPSLVALAMRKVYPHRLQLVSPEREKSVQWGSEIEAVREVMNGLTVEDVIGMVLQSVATPL